MHWDDIAFWRTEFNLYISQMEGEYDLDFEEGIWIAVPKPSDRPIISDADAGDEMFEFTASCSICKPHKQSFRLRFEPGVPVKLNLLQDHTGAVMDDSMNFSIDLSRDSPMTPFTLVCFDAYGNRTRPKSGEKWTVSAEAGGPLEKFQPVLCNPDGAITLENLQPKVSANGYVEQTLVLSASMQGSKEKPLKVKWTFGVNITASQRPSEMRVWDVLC